MDVRFAVPLLLGSVLAVASVSASAGTVAWGTVAAPWSGQANQDPPPGPVLDIYSFSIVGQPLTFTSFVATGFSKYTGIPDLQGELFREGALFATGGARTVYAYAAGPMSREVQFDPVVLSGGDYELRFSGMAYTSTETFHGGPLNAHYSGSASFVAPHNVPEPSTLALAGLGLLAAAASAAWTGAGKRRVQAAGADGTSDARPRLAPASASRPRPTRLSTPGWGTAAAGPNPKSLRASVNSTPSEV